MSNNIEFCRICGSQSSSVYSCSSCKCVCCKQCLSSHLTNNVCQLITDHCVNMCDVCDIHKEIEYNGFCLKCSKTICKTCHLNQADHSETVVSESEAMKQVKEELQSRKHDLLASIAKAEEMIHIIPEKLGGLNNTKMNVEAKGKSYGGDIYNKSLQLVGEIKEDMNRIDNICEERQNYVDRINETLAELGSLQKIDFPLTFLTVWMSISQKLSGIEKNEIDELHEKKIFNANFEYSSRLSELFGSHFRKSECQSKVEASVQTVDQKDCGDEIENLIDSFSRNVTIQETDDEAQRKHQVLIDEMKTVEDEIKKLQAEKRKYSIENKTNQFLMNEKKKLEDEVKGLRDEKEKYSEERIEEKKKQEDELKKLQAEKREYTIERGLLTQDKLKMRKSVQDLYESVLSVHPKQELRERSVKVTKEEQFPEMVELIKNNIIEIQGLLNGSLSYGKEMREGEVLLQKKEPDENTITEDTHKAKNEECEHLKRKVALLEEQIKELKITVVENENVQKENCRLKDEVQKSLRAKERFQMESSELLKSINPLRDYVTYNIQSEDLTHGNIDPPDTKLVSTVVDLVLKHTCNLNEKVTMFTSQIHSKDKTITELRDSNCNLEQQIKKLQEHTLRLQKEKAQLSSKYRIVCKEKDDLTEGTNSVQMVMDENEQNIKKLLAERENMKKLLSEKETQVKLAKEDTNKRNQATQQLKHLLEQAENTISDSNRTINRLKDIIADHEKTIIAIKKDKDDLQTRLSSVAGEKLTKGNAAITDLGDPNRPMKIGEKYGELYDNEWTDAMENITTAKAFYSNLKDSEIEEIIICHLHRLLKCCYAECLSKADDQIKTLLKAFTEATCLTMASKEEIDSLHICKEAIALRKLKSEEFAKFLFENKVLCKTAMDNWNYSYKNEEVMKLLMTSTFFEKCVHLCWCMVIQDPVMYLDEDLTPDTPFDKNTYKEFVRSGDKIAYVVWPALFLHKDGPLLYKGVVQAYRE